MRYLKVFFLFRNYCIIAIQKLVRLLRIDSKKNKILYRSNNFIIINKDYDVKINSNNKEEKTVQTYLKKALPFLSSPQLYHEFYFVHRLDYSTSGLMCIPVHKKACQVVSKIIQDRACEKYYVALVRGHISKCLLDLKLPIGRDTRVAEIEKMCVSSRTGTRSARTVLVVLEHGLYDQYPATKVLLRPITGRRHQIRVHCSHIGHTVVGDFTYSNKKDVAPYRMYLHALRLVIPNEIENLDIETSDPFSSNKEKLWKPFFVHHSLMQAFTKIDLWLLNH